VLLTVRVWPAMAGVSIPVVLRVIGGGLVRLGLPGIRKTAPEPVLTPGAPMAISLTVSLLMRPTAVSEKPAREPAAAPRNSTLPMAVGRLLRSIGPRIWPGGLGVAGRPKIRLTRPRLTWKPGEPAMMAGKPSAW